MCAFQLRRCFTQYPWVVGLSTSFASRILPCDGDMAPDLSPPCAVQAQRSGDRLVTKEHICRQCRFVGKGAAFVASELLEADGVDGPPGI